MVPAKYPIRSECAVRFGENSTIRTRCFKGIASIPLIVSEELILDCFNISEGHSSYVHRENSFVECQNHWHWEVAKNYLDILSCCCQW